MNKPNDSETIYKDEVLIEKSKPEVIEVDSLNYWAVKILGTADPFEKINLTNHVAQKWKNNELTVNNETIIEPPVQPLRNEDLKVIDSAKIRRGKGGTLVNMSY